MVQASETYLVEFRATGDAGAALKKLGDQAETTGRRIDTSGRQGGDALQNMAARGVGATASLISGLTKVATAAGVATAAFLATSAAVGKRLVQVAAEAEAVGGKFDVVFGEFAENQRAITDELAETLGRSVVDLQKFQSSFQDTFVPFGFARDEAAKLSARLTELSVDLASFNDVQDADAAADLQTALVGNVEVMRKYGVVINQTTLEQELLRSGMADSIAEATEQEKLLARLNLIIAGTADAQGDAVRTQDEFNNQMKRAQGAIKDASVALGTELIITIQEAVEELGGMDEVLELVELGLFVMKEGAKVVIGVFKDGAAATQGWIEELGGTEEVASRAVRVFEILGGGLSIVATGFSQAGSTAILFLDTLRATGLAAKIAANEIEGALGEGVASAASFLSFARADFLRFVEGIDSGVRDLLSETFKDLLEGLATVTKAVGLLPTPFGKAVRLARIEIEDLISALDIDGVQDPLGLGTSAAQAEQAGKLFDDIAKGIAENTKNTTAELREELAEFDLFGEKFGEYAAGVDENAEKVAEAWGRITKAFAELQSEDKLAAQDAAVDLVNGFVDAVIAAADQAGDAVSNALAGLFSGGGGGTVDNPLSEVFVDAEAQAKNFAGEYANLWSQVTPTIEEQRAAIEKWQEAELARLDALAIDNSLTQEQVAQLQELVFRIGEEKTAKLESVGATSKLQDAVGGYLESAGDRLLDNLIDTAFAAGKGGQSFEEFTASVLEGLAKIAAKQLILAALNALFPGAGVAAGAATSGGGGGGGGFLGLFAGGGTVSGPTKHVADLSGLPVNFYAGGGVVDSPQLFVAGEGKNAEAIVPMPNGAVPVQFTNGGGGVSQMNITFNVTSLEGDRAAAVIVRERDTIESLIAEALSGGNRSLIDVTRNATS